MSPAVDLHQERCPVCGGPVKLRRKKRNSRWLYSLECNGDCWTQTGWHSSIAEARDKWHMIEEEIREENDNAAE